MQSSFSFSNWPRLSRVFGKVFSLDKKPTKMQWIDAETERREDDVFSRFCLIRDCVREKGYTPEDHVNSALKAVLCSVGRTNIFIHRYQEEGFTEEEAKAIANLHDYDLAFLRALMVDPEDSKKWGIRDKAYESVFLDYKFQEIMKSMGDNIEVLLRRHIINFSQETIRDLFKRPINSFCSDTPGTRRFCDRYGKTVFEALDRLDESLQAAEDLVA